MNTIADLRVKLGELTDRANAIQAKADTDKRDLSQEEADEIDAILNTFEKTEVEIERRTKIEAQTQRSTEGSGRRTEPTPVVVSAAASEAAAQGRQRGDDGLRNTRLV